jgi:hypothetical protein
MSNLPTEIILKIAREVLRGEVFSFQGPLQPELQERQRDLKTLRQAYIETAKLSREIGITK